MNAPKATLALIEDLVIYRDRISDRADRDMLADVANELSRLNALKADLLEALTEAVDDLLMFSNSRWSEFEGSDDDLVGKARAAIAKAVQP
jgi:hypothetical protein